MESEAIKKYFSGIEGEIDWAYEVANTARKLGYDPEKKVDIPVARNMAERVEGLISAVAPQILGSGIKKRIQELEKNFSFGDWRISLVIAEEVAREKFCKFKDLKEAIETGIRVGFAYHTNGIVAAPLEGFVEINLKKRRDGKEYLAMKYAGPIRGAGGTAASFSVVLADYVRKKFGFERYDPDENEISRLATEIEDYHERVTNLQYKPSEEEVRFLASRLPVEVDGDPTEQIEASNYKDLPRIGTNRIRGGVCLVIAEGISQKAPKIWKQISQWHKEYGLEWDFLEEFIFLQKVIKSGRIKKTEEKVAPNYTYLMDIVAGRPVLAHPMSFGGFRLRYGRCRNSGYSCCSINPALMHILKDYLAIGTQLKLERPGKATALTTCDTIDGPIVLLKNGDVVKINSAADAKKFAGEAQQILFLGDILVSYGDFFDRGHVLMPPGYCEEMWVQDLEKAIIKNFGTLDCEKAGSFLGINADTVESMLKNPLLKIKADTAINISERLNVPLHPRYTYYWKALSFGQLKALHNQLINSRIEYEGNEISKIVMALNDCKKLLEAIGLEHKVINNEFIVLGKNDSKILDYMMKRMINFDDKGALEIINSNLEFPVKDKAGCFIGARMGRPEKAKMRKLTGSPQVLFPVGEEGGRLRSFQSAMDVSYIEGDFPIHFCEACKSETIYPICEICDKPTKKQYYCKSCGIVDQQQCRKHGDCQSYVTKKIDSQHYFTKALEKLNIKIYPDLIKGVRGTSSKDHIPENLIKGILRAKHDIYVNKDGTTRYDMTEIPITHFKPREIGTGIEKLKSLGYVHDIYGNWLANDDQIIELKPQDVILPACPVSLDEPADDVLIRISNFVDELLVNVYKLKPFYNFKTREDTIGALIIGLAPHISAGMVGRVIGYSQTQGCFAHPLWHAALRRDCDGDEACFILLMDALLNFSRQFLPDSRGGRTMDSPLVLTLKLVPSEVDDMVHRMDVSWKYPPEYYKAAEEFRQPSEVSIEKLGDRLMTELQYEKIGFTHNTSNINSGVLCSAYKTIPNMEDKLKGQMELAEMISAVETSDVARLVIEKHFLKDTKGNLRKFSMQQFRCVKCNEKYRRPPLIGKCINCGNKLIFTVSEGSIVKYLEPSFTLAEKYNVPAYLKQTLDILRRRVEGVFGKEKDKQEGLTRWFAEA